METTEKQMAYERKAQRICDKVITPKINKALNQNVKSIFIDKNDLNYEKPILNRVFRMLSEAGYEYEYSYPFYTITFNV